MTWVAQDEYSAIRASWKSAKGGKFDFGTARENLDRCHANRVAAAKEVADLRALYQRLPPGDVKLTGGVVKSVGRDGEETEEHIPPLRLLIQKAKAEERGWAEYVAHYQPLAAAEPAPRRPTDPIPEDRRLPRERDAGDDDVDEAIR
jgi:hypothetical protein